MWSPWSPGPDWSTLEGASGVMEPLSEETPGNSPYTQAHANARLTQLPCAAAWVWEGLGSYGFLAICRVVLAQVPDFDHPRNTGQGQL